MITGNLQRRWQEEKPAVYDKEKSIVCLDIVAQTQRDEEGTEVDGWSYIPVEIDRLSDYGHVKSQLIEAGFSQKDEFGLLMNAVSAVLSGVKTLTSWAGFKSAMQENSDVQEFLSFQEYREMCADAARQVVAANS